MLVFHCDHCDALVFFENVKCLKCEHRLGFLPDILDLSALEPKEKGTWLALSKAVKGKLYRECQNSAQHQVCNWMVPHEDPEQFCIACRLNKVIPDLSAPGNVQLWHKLELAKRRLIYTIKRLQLPLQSGAQANQAPLAFNFVADIPGQPPALTGHATGLITVNIAEADDAERERRRVNLREPHRTLLGHFRHEIGHYYWDRLIAATPRLEEFRKLFGDERPDYGQALQSYYAKGAPADWQTRFISPYASAHPWEDWAESWAHYFHMTDAMETAASFGMMLKPRGADAKMMGTDTRQVRVGETEFDQILARWFPLTYALNSLNRGMGLTDLYPFVLSDPVIAKLRFIHDVIEQAKS